MTKVQEQNISDFLQIINSGNLPVFCKVSSSLKLEFHNVSWNQYWHSISEKSFSESEELAQFERSFRKYIQEKFSAPSVKEYCLAFWRLLKCTLTLHQKSPEKYSRILSAVTGFGTFGIGFSPEKSLAAGVFNLIHPVYQTSKIQKPSHPESAKYLPLVSPHSLFGKQSASLFYYYRQLAFGFRPDARFLLYPSVNQDDRFSSFEALHFFTQGIHPKKDTHVLSRAAWLSRLIDSSSERKNNADKSFRVLDIGGGTGQLFRSIIETIEKRKPNFFQDNSIEWTLVERPGINYRPHVSRSLFFKKIHKIYSCHFKIQFSPATR
ncbi:MAG: hypothetical protein Q4C96_11535 [Planctomycetia bacterium]|nr:hypothetical protein [Planctomycetia bacterium]